MLLTFNTFRTNFLLQNFYFKSFTAGIFLYGSGACFCHSHDGWEVTIDTVYALQALNITESATLSPDITTSFNHVIYQKYQFFQVVYCSFYMKVVLIAVLWIQIQLNWYWYAEPI